MFIAMNRFSVNPDRGPEFEQRWRFTRELPAWTGWIRSIRAAAWRRSGRVYLASPPEFAGEFLAWAQSDHFRQAHAQELPEGLILGHPRASFYEAVVLEA